MRAFPERHFEAIDQLGALVCAGALFAYGHYVNHDVVLEEMLGSNRATVYGTIARLFATVFGFGLTATSIVLTFAKSPRLDTLRQSKQWATLWRVFTRGLGTFLLVTFAGVLGLLLDRDRAPRPLVAYTIAYLTLVGAARLYRLFWAVKSLMLIMIRPEPQEPPRHLHEAPPSTVHTR